MRTTIDLPEDLHRIATSIARDRNESLSKTVVDLVRRGLGSTVEIGRQATGERNGIKTFSVGRVITDEDVRSLDDE
ncbi:MAG: hypothetical protein ACRDP9_02590 [Kribbellaceae bacterium]